MNQELVQLSKKISYILRHHPEDYQLKLDEYGFIALDELFQAIYVKDGQRVTLADLKEISRSSAKKRFEIIDYQIRATYGHSLEAKVQQAAVVPPDYLFHGTAQRFLASIERQGLLPKGRQYVHLSDEVSTAQVVGKRRDQQPIILKIYAKKAYEAGIQFYDGGDHTYLAAEIPALFLK